MTTFGAAGLVMMIAVTDRRVIALLTALIGFLVSSRGASYAERASLFRTLARTLRDIAVASPSPSRRTAEPRMRFRRRRSVPIGGRDC